MEIYDILAIIYYWAPCQCPVQLGNVINTAGKSYIGTNEVNYLTHSIPGSYGKYMACGNRIRNAFPATNGNIFTSFVEIFLQTTAYILRRVIIKNKRKSIKTNLYTNE